MKLRVLVVDDSRFYRNRVVEMVSAAPGLQVVDTAENGRDAVQKVREKRPDVITMDIELPVVDGIAAVTGPVAARLDTLCKVDVKEARHGDGCVPGTVLIAPGGKQLEFERAGAI